jgi:hypothetical protein
LILGLFLGCKNKLELVGLFRIIDPLPTKKEIAKLTGRRERG